MNYKSKFENIIMGETMHTLENSYGVTDDTGKIIRIEGSIQDVTVFRNAEELITRERLALTYAHHVGSPLGVLTAALDFLEDEINDSDDGRAAFRDVMAAYNRALLIIKKTRDALLSDTIEYTGQLGKNTMYKIGEKK